MPLLGRANLNSSCRINLERWTLRASLHKEGAVSQMRWWCSSMIHRTLYLQVRLTHLALINPTSWCNQFIWAMKSMSTLPWSCQILYFPLDISVLGRTPKFNQMLNNKRIEHLFQLQSLWVLIQRKSFCHLKLLGISRVLSGLAIFKMNL